jgi:hypothetical protein
MPLLDLYRVVRDASRDKRTALKENRSHLGHRLLDVFLRTWDLGFTAFGGPPVHFRIFHNRFVLGSGGKAPWIDEQTVCDDSSSFNQQIYRCLSREDTPLTCHSTRSCLEYARPCQVLEAQRCSFASSSFMLDSYQLCLFS